MGDEILENVFKDVEEQIMSLAKVLSGLYFQSLPTQSANNSSQPSSLSQSSGNFLNLPSHSHHAQQASGSVSTFKLDECIKPFFNQ